LGKSERIRVPLPAAKITIDKDIMCILSSICHHMT